MMDIKLNPKVDLNKIIQEPNFKMFLHNGHICVIVRTPYGHYCGYVGVTESSSLYKTDYELIYDINVHGGLTYAINGLYCFEGMLDNVWFFGFDCAHFNDAVLYNHYAEESGIYRDFEYVKENVINLSNQLKLIEDKNDK